MYICSYTHVDVSTSVFIYNVYICHNLYSLAVTEYCIFHDRGFKMIQFNRQMNLCGNTRQTLFWQKSV